MYFKAAAAMAQLGDFPRVKIGCVVIYGHRIISSGFNSMKTDPVQKRYNRYRFAEDTPAAIHAEIMALKPLIGRNDIDFKKIELYVYRSGNRETPLLARPCPSCMQLIKNLGIRNIYFTTNNGYSYENILE